MPLDARARSALYRLVRLIVHIEHFPGRCASLRALLLDALPRARSVFSIWCALMKPILRNTSEKIIPSASSLTLPRTSQSEQGFLICDKLRVELRANFLDQMFQKQLSFVSVTVP